MSVTGAIVGATGAVGRTLLEILAERRFPLDELRLFATDRSAGERLSFGGREIAVESLSAEALRDVDWIFFAIGAQAAREWVPRALEGRGTVIDNSYAYRMDPEVPLVVPEVNGDALAAGPRLIANPNCSTIQLVLALAPIQARVAIERVVVSTYQSVSGSGSEAMSELDEQVSSPAGNEPPRVYPHRIAFNVIPQVDDFADDGYTREEHKLMDESRKIMGVPGLRLTATAVRVPVRISHSAAVNVTLSRAVEPEEIRSWLTEAPGVRVQDDPEQSGYPTPLEAAGRDDAYVGRVRRDPSEPRAIDLWISCDNLRKGAALNAVQIAESLRAHEATRTRTGVDA